LAWAWVDRAMGGWDIDVQQFERIPKDSLVK
jgi:hypothetical protein